MLIVIKSPNDYYTYILPFVDLNTEEFWITALSADKRVLRSQRIFRGTLDACPVFPRDILRFVCLANASSFIASHTHPSGCPKPSREDCAATKQIKFLSELIEIPMVDHIILTELSYYSYAENNWTELKDYLSPGGRALSPNGVRKS